MRKYTLPLLLIVLTISQSYAQEPSPKKPFKVNVPAKVTANDHIIIDASTAKGEVFFIFDEVLFPKERATYDSTKKKLILSTGVNGNYTITIVSLEDKAKEKVTFSVTGGLIDPIVPPPLPPPEPTTLKEVLDAIKTINNRLDLLEKIKPIPPPPVDPLTVTLSETYTKDNGTIAQRKVLSSLYRNAAKLTVFDKNFTKPNDIYNALRATINSKELKDALALQGITFDPVTNLLNTRKAIADFQVSIIGLPNTPLTDQSRLLISNTFYRIADSLDAIK